MNHYALAAFLCFINSLTLGVFVWIRGPSRKLVYAFTAFSFFLCLYGLAFFNLCTSTNKTFALFWGKVTMSSAMFIALSYLHLSLVAIDKKVIAHQLIRVYSIGVIFSLVNLPSTLILKNPRPIQGLALMNRAGPLYLPTLIIFFGVIIYTSYELLRKINYSTGSQRNQMKYLLIGPIIGFLGGSTNYIIAYDVTIPIVNPYGGYLVTIFTLIIAYAILKHQLLDINIIFRKTLIYSIIITFLFVASVIILFILAQIFGVFLPQKTFWLTLFLVAALALLFQPLYHWSTSLVDRSFFKGTLPQIAEDLQQAEKLAVLASGLAHEIKNPLVPIKTYIQNLPNNLNNPRFIDKITKVIPAEVDKITDIINQLRNFASPPPLSISKVNVHNLIDKRLNLLEQDFTARDIVVERHYSPTLPEINADPIQLERVFTNIFLNAIDAMPNGGNLSIITDIESNQSMSIKIADTGIGIEEEDLLHIFDPFFSKGEHKGSGLGLAVTNQIIKEHNGSIQVESTLGKGTIFYIYLPIEHI